MQANVLYVEHCQHSVEVICVSSSPEALQLYTQPFDVGLAMERWSGRMRCMYFSEFRRAQ
jgi:hypothetical protein